MKMTINIKNALKGCTVILSGETSATLYSSSRTQTPKRIRFNSTTSRRAYVLNWIKNQRAAEASRAARRCVARDLVVGDVLRSSWGYDQTNIDYFQVVKLVGKTMVEVRELNQLRESSAIDMGTCAPVVNDFAGEAVRVKAQGDHVRVGHHHAYKMVAQVVAGAKIYNKSEWSSYH